MVIQERDRSILQTCFEQQFLVFEHIQTHFFPKSSRQEAYRRLRELETAGYIKRQRLATWSNSFAIRLTAKGTQVGREFAQHKTPQKASLDLSTLAHDVLVTSVRLRLAQLWNMVWIPERSIRAEYPEMKQIPDGIALFYSGKRWAIEIENSQKSKERYHRIFRRWSEETKPPLMLYVFADSKLREQFHERLKESPVAQRLVMTTVLWDDLKAGMPVAWSVKGEFNIFAKREY